MLCDRLTDAVRLLVYPTFFFAAWSISSGLMSTRVPSGSRCGRWHSDNLTGGFCEAIHSLTRVMGARPRIA
jgi:hypothetical protein